MLPDNYGVRRASAIYGKRYHNVSVLYPVASLKPTRSAAGMAYTGSRSGRLLKGDAAQLSLFGTLDPLARYSFDVIRRPCECCGSKSKGKLSLKPDAFVSRRRLAQLREKYRRQLC